MVVESAERPEFGRIVPEWQSSIHRERIAYSYRIVYRVDPDRLVVLAVLHGAMLLEEHVQDRRA